METRLYTNPNTERLTARYWSVMNQTWRTVSYQSDITTGDWAAMSDQDRERCRRLLRDTDDTSGQDVIEIG